MNTRSRILIAAAALTFAATGATACSNDNSSSSAGTVPIPGISATNPLEDSDWFKQNFGTPVLAVTEVKPKAIEQAKDLKGVVLPQNRAPLDGPVMWERVRCEALPITSTDGPTRRRGDTVFGGFAHTPLGAALAAYHGAAYGGSAGAFTDIAMFAAPADRDRLAAQLPHMEPSATLNDPGCLARKKNLTRPAQWTAEQISPDMMRVQLWWPALPGTTQGYTLDYSVVWQDNDWYLSEQTFADLMALGGKRPREPQYAPPPTGWTTW